MELGQFKREREGNERGMEDEGKVRNGVRPVVGPPRARCPTLRRSEAEFELRILLLPRSLCAHTISPADPSEARGVEAAQLALFALLDSHTERVIFSLLATGSRARYRFPWLSV